MQSVRVLELQIRDCESIVFLCERVSVFFPKVLAYITIGMILTKENI